MGKGSLESRFNLSALRPFTHLNSHIALIDSGTTTPLGVHESKKGSRGESHP